MDQTAVLYGTLLGVAVAWLLNRMAGKPRNSDQRRIEEKIDLLLRQAGLEYDPFAAVAPEVAEAVRAGDKIRAIKLYRDHTGAGLKEAKDTIDQLYAELVGVLGGHQSNFVGILEAYKAQRSSFANLDRRTGRSG